MEQLLEPKKVAKASMPACDLVANKISRQLRKYKEKRNNRKHSTSVKTTEVFLNQPPSTDVTEVLQNAEPQLAGRGGAHEVLCHAPHDSGGSPGTAGADRP
jgi:hypothetical protein